MQDEQRRLDAESLEEHYAAVADDEARQREEDYERSTWGWEDE